MLNSVGNSTYQLQQLLGETTRYLGESDGRLDLTALQNTY